MAVRTRPGWNVLKNSSGKEHYVYIGKDRGLSRLDKPEVPETEIHQAVAGGVSRLLPSFCGRLTHVLSQRQVPQAWKLYETATGFLSMDFKEAELLAEQSMIEVEREFDEQFLNFDEMRITPPLAWRTVKEAQETVRGYLSFRYPGAVAALRLLAIHFVHCKALHHWSTRERLLEYLETNFDHLHRRTFVLLDRSCAEAKLTSAGQMIYLAWLYGMTALFMNGAKVFIEEHPEEWAAGAMGNLNGMTRGRKSKALEELLAHRATGGFFDPAFGILYDGMSRPEREFAELQPKPGFIYPQIRERFPATELRRLSQHELFERVRQIDHELQDVDVMDLVTRGEEQPVDLSSMKVFQVQQMGRSLMHYIFKTPQEKQVPGSPPAEDPPIAEEPLEATEDDADLLSLKEAVLAGDRVRSNELLKNILRGYAGEEAVRRGYIESPEEAKRIPCRVLWYIEQLFSDYNDSFGPGHSYFYLHWDPAYPGEAWGGSGAWLGYIGHRLEECGITLGPAGSSTPPSRRARGKAHEEERRAGEQAVV